MAPLLDPVEAPHHSLQLPVQGRGVGVLTDFDVGSKWIEWILLLLGLSKFVQTGVSCQNANFHPDNDKPSNDGVSISWDKPIQAGI